MRRYASGLLVMFLLLVTSGSHAAHYLFEFYGKNNIPSVGYPVLTRMFRFNGTLAASVLKPTDNQGHAWIELDTSWGSEVKPKRGSYTLVGCRDKTIGLLHNSNFPNCCYNKLDRSIETSPITRIEGIVVDLAGKPVPNVKVTLISVMVAMENMLYDFNRPAESVTTPDLVVTTNAQGGFAFPLIHSRTFNTEEQIISAQLVARIERNGEMLAGDKSIEYQVIPQENGGGCLATDEIRLIVEATRSIHGKVLDALTGKPIAQASVTLAADPYTSGNNCLPAVTTNADEEFVVNGVMPCGTLIAVARKDGYAIGCDEVTARCEVTLDPLVEVSGRVVDSATGKAPPIPLSLMLYGGRQYRHGDLYFGGTREIIRMKPNQGTFSVMMPVGNLAISTGISPVYLTKSVTGFPVEYSDASFGHFNMTIRAFNGPLTRGGLRNVVVTVQRESAFVFHVTPMKPYDYGNFTWEMLSPGMTMTNSLFNPELNELGWYCWPAKYWGEQAKFQFTVWREVNRRHNVEKFILTDRTEYTASPDPQCWPYEVTIQPQP